MLNRLFPHAQPAYVDALTNDRAHQQLAEAGISDTALRLAHFVAQIAAETDGLRIAEENGNYSAARLREIFPRHFTADEAEKYAHHPEAILNRAYADRMGNGSEESGDGWRYRGRGGNQLTGRENYRRAGGHIGIDLEEDPYIAAAPNYILSIALWEWTNCDLNAWADRDDILAVSRGINCGSPTSSIKPNGLDARRAWLTKVKAALAGASVVAENATTQQSVAFASPVTPEAPMQSEPTSAPEAVSGGPKWFALARAEIGTCEVAGEHDNPAILRYYADAGHPEIQHDEVAWCAGFACAMLERAGEHSPKTLGAREFMRWGKPLDKPKIGCVAVFSRGDPRTYAGHVGFYAGEESGYILLLAGNQGDEVSIARVPKSRLLGYRWPVTATNSTTAKGVVTGVVATATTAAAAASQIAATAPDQVLAIGGEMKGMASYAPWLGLIGSIVVVVALGCVAWAHWRDLSKNGK